MLASQKKVEALPERASVRTLVATWQTPRRGSVSRSYRCKGDPDALAGTIENPLSSVFERLGPTVLWTSASCDPLAVFRFCNF